MSQSSLSAVYKGMKESGGDPDSPYYYLGGPMTGIPEFNFPRFLEVQGILESKSYNIISPADIEIGHDDTGASYVGYLERDFIIVSLPNCIGGIFLEGWEKSRGARGETWVLQFLGKQLYQYRDPAELVAIDRDEQLALHGIPNEGVPSDQQGLLTSGEASDGVLPQHMGSSENLSIKPDGYFAQVLSSAGPVTQTILSRMKREDEEWGGKI